MILAEKYLPLYRKYRPSTFKEVVGQEVVVKTLLNAIEHDRVAHAYLFCGPRGTGKTSIARIFAKTLNCQNPKNGEPCGKCPHCVDMNNSVSMDVVEIDAASNRKVEDARNLLEKVQFTPVLGKNKIYIIDEVHMLTTEAFNTLLKTLEEPPENLIFILATTEAHKVLETIVSRCQKFDFRRISVNDIKNRLKEISQKENIIIDDDAIEFIARRSAGGLRDALALLDQSTVLALDNKSITKKDIITLLGSVDDEDLFNLANLIAQKNSQEVIGLLKSIVDKGNDPNQIIKELISYFRNLMLASVCKNNDEASHLLDISSENCEKIITLSKEFSSQELVQIIEKLSEQERNIRNSTNPYLWLDVAIINAATRENILAQKALLERIENLENQLNSGFNSKSAVVKHNYELLKQPPVQKVETKVEQIQPPVETKPDKEEPVEFTKQTTTPSASQDNNKVINVETKNPEPVEQKAVDTGMEEKQSSAPLNEVSWDTFLGELQNISATLFALLKVQSRPVCVNSDKIELVFRNDVFIDKIKKRQPILEEVAQKLLGTKPRMIFRAVSEEDFKKKPSPDLTIYKDEEPKNIQTAADSNVFDVKKQHEFPSKEEINEVESDSAMQNKSDFSMYDLSDGTRQILDVFSGKIID